MGLIPQNELITVAPVSAVDASTAQVLRARLEALEGITSAVIDEATLTVLIRCEGDCSPAVLGPQIDDVLKGAGLDPKDATVNLLTDLAARRRVKFAGAERLVEHNKVRIRIRLEWNGETFYGDALGENGELIELRTSAAAALSALESVMGEQLGVRLVGVKQVKAFDSELMVVAMYRSGGSPQRLVGSVAVGDDPRRAAAVAVLNALNRILGNYLSVRE